MWEFFPDALAEAAHLFTNNLFLINEAGECLYVRKIELTAPNFFTLELDNQKVYDFPVDKVFILQFNSSALTSHPGKQMKQEIFYNKMLSAMRF